MYTKKINVQVTVNSQITVCCIHITGSGKYLVDCH